MSRKLAFLLLVLVFADFALLSAYTLADQGYWAIFAHLLQNSAGWQAGADLLIACSLAMIWMVADARRQGRRVWPYLLITGLFGSFGPLLYLLVGFWPRRELASPALA